MTIVMHGGKLNLCNINFVGLFTSTTDQDDKHENTISRAHNEVLHEHERYSNFNTNNLWGHTHIAVTSSQIIMMNINSQTRSKED